MEILPDHATLVGTILFSKAYIKHGHTEEKFVLRQGSVLVDDKGACSILALEADKESEISVQSMREYLEYLDAEMSKDSGYNDYQLKFLREQRESLAQSIQENGEK